jgi:hypothetical protein
MCYDKFSLCAPQTWRHPGNVSAKPGAEMYHRAQLASDPTRVWSISYTR